MEEEDPDAVDTDSIPVISEADLVEAGYPAAEDEHPYDAADEAGYPDAEHGATTAMRATRTSGIPTLPSRIPLRTLTSRVARPTPRLPRRATRTMR